MRVYVVPHTHWDREWYRTAGEFRQRLVVLIDELLDATERPREPFLLDGQTILIEDYLAVRPERAAELSQALREGWLEAGPWFVLSDELIPCGEALVRNLLIGRRTLRAMRASSPRVAYSPDAFGHAAALPELAAGFGLAVALVWRGYGGSRWPAGDSTRWRALSGAEVLLHHLPPDGYEFGASLSPDESAARARWVRIIAVLAPRATLGVALLTNGADHHARQRDSAAAHAALARAAHPHTVAAATLGGWADSLVGAAATAAIPVVAGELRDSYGYTWTLQGTLAARAHQKRANAIAERLLVRDVEPWLALLQLRTGAAPTAALRAAWRDLLRAHPHDSLCGTSIDAVATAVDQRIASATAQGLLLRDEAVRALLGHSGDAARPLAAEWKPYVIVRNRAARTRSGVCEVLADVAIADVPVGPGSAALPMDASAPVPVASIAACPPAQLLSRTRTFAREESARGYPRTALVEQQRLLTWVQAAPSLGLVALPLGPAAARRRLPRARAGRGWIANDAITIRALPGALAFEQNGRAIASFLGFTTRGEQGDLYTPSGIPGTQRPAVMRKARVTARGPWRAELTTQWRVPVAERALLRATGGRVSHPARYIDVMACVQLDAGTDFTRVHVVGHNSIEDVRLRFDVVTGLAGPDAGVFADAAFGVLHRRDPQVSPEDQAAEHVVRSAPLHRYVSLFTPSAGATLFSDGMAEYEADATGNISVTLLRAVGELSRAHLAERLGHAGWPASTPLAQCPGPFEACFGFALHGPRSAAAVDRVERMAEDVLLPLQGETWRSAISPLPHLEGVLLAGAGLSMSSVHPGEAPGVVVLRCVNHRKEAVPGEWRVAGATEAWLARLDETLLGALKCRGGAIDFVAPPSGVVTILAASRVSEGQAP